MAKGKNPPFGGGFFFMEGIPRAGSWKYRKTGGHGRACLWRAPSLFPTHMVYYTHQMYFVK